jgi:hypothetical protein
MSTDEQKAAMVKADMRKEVAYGHARTLEAFKVIYRSASVLLVLSARTSKGEPEVAFIESPTEEAAFAYLWETGRKTNAPLKWRADRYRK